MSRRSPESIAKQRATIAKRIAEGTWPTHRNTWTEDQRRRHAATKRAKALWNRRLARDYWEVLTPEGYRYEHRVVMEHILGRALDRSEHVHHINHDGLDNWPDNLELRTHSDHSRHHALTGTHLNPMAGLLPPGVWARHYDACVECGTTDRKHLAKGLCSTCYRRPYGKY